MAVAVCLATGIGLYFTLPYDIPLTFFMALAIALLMVVFRFSYLPQKIVRSLLYIIVCIIGFVVADMRTNRVAAPVLDEIADYYTVTGLVDERQTNSKGRDHLIVSDLKISGLRVDETPAKIKVQVRTKINDSLAPGDRVQFDANLSAPHGPVAAGSFNFARKSWFDHIGGVGFAISEIVQISAVSHQESRLNKLRHDIGLKLVERMEAKEAALATALLTGNRTALPTKVVDEMRDAGLAHLLAISGLHMGLVTASVFFIFEALLSLIPAVALRMPPAKIAALFAWAAALGYLALSGMPVSTLRAFLMVSIALMGVLMNRRAISVRSIALAAIIIMLIWPETVISVGFQMSFAAVTGLVIFYEKWGRKLLFGGFSGDGKAFSFVQKLSGLFVASIATSLVSEIAIAPIALYHFQTVALYGLLANLIAVPLMSFLIMPLLLLTLLLMPFGLEGLVAPLVEYCLSFLMAIATEVSAMPGSTVSTPMLPFMFLGLALLIGLSLTMLRGRLLYGFSALCVVLMVYVSQHTNEPDIYISKGGKILAIIQKSGDLAFDSSRHSYQKDAWLRLNGERDDASPTLLRIKQDCDGHGCLYSSDRDDIPTIVRVTTLEGLMNECGRAKIIIAQGINGKYCRSAGLVIDYKLLNEGPISIWIEEGEIKEIETSTKNLGNRPWVRAKISDIGA